MSKAARSLKLYSYVMFIFGVLLVARPEMIAPGESGATLGIVRSLGAMLIVLAYYYRVAATNELTAFFHASVVGRLGLAGFQAFAVQRGWLNKSSLGGAALDFLSALWTYSALRSDARR
jgi:hypothetical protein